MGYPVTLNGRTYTLADFEGQNYVDGLPDAFEDFVTHAGNLYSTTSTTSNSIGTGSKTFTVESSKPYQVGTPLRITDSAAPSTNWIDAIVTAYSGTTLTVDAVAYAGSGTKTSWNINIGGGGTSYTGTLPVAQGGTGATTAAAARTNLDVYSKADADSRFLNVSGEASDVSITGDLTVDTSVFKVDSGSNRVGVGTASPSYNLEVQGANPQVNIEATTNNWSALRITSGATQANYIFFFDDTEERARISVLDGEDFQISTGATPVQRLKLDGSETIFNDTGANVDFRVESDADPNMLWVDAGQNRVKIATASDYGAGVLNVDGAIYFANSANKVIQGLTPTGWGYSPGAYGVLQIGAPNAGGTVSIGYDPSSNTSGSFTGDGGEMLFKGEMDFLVPNTTDTDFEYMMRLKQNDGVIFNEKGWNNIDFRIESDNNANMFVVDASNDKVQIGSQIFGSSLTISRGEFVSFNSNIKTVSSSGSTTYTMFTRSPDVNVAVAGTVYIAGENSGGSVQFGIIIDFFMSNGTLSSTTREAGSSQGTTTASVAENGAAIELTVSYAGGLGGAIRFNAGGHASVASY